MKKTRIISLLVILVMVLSLFAACGETAAEPTKAPATQAPATQAPSGGEETPDTPDEPEVEIGKVQLPICEEVTDLTMMFMWDQGMAGNLTSSPDDFDGFKWLEEQTNVHIEFITINNTVWTDQFNITVASQEYPDLWTRAARTYSAGVQHAIEEEIFMDVTDLLAEYAPNYKAVLDADESLQKNLYTDDGRMAVFYPIYTEPMPGSSNGLVIRQDWLDELNLEVPVTYDDYEEVMEAFLVNYDVEMGIMMSQYGTLPSNAIVSGFNIFAVADTLAKPFYIVDGEVKLGRVGPEFKEYLTLISDWYSRGFITPDFTSWSGVDSMSRNPLYAPAITTGKVGIFNVSTSDVTKLPPQCEDENAAFTALTDPVHKEGDIIKVGKPGFAAMYEKTGVAISTQCEEWEIAMKWLDWFYTEEGAIFNMCGLEGITWEYDENGEVWWTDMYLNPEPGVTTGNILYKYAVGTITWGLSMKNEMDGNVYEKLGDKKWEARKTWYSNVTFEYTYPDGATLNAEEGDEFSDYYGDFQTFIEETTPLFVTGEKSLDEYEAYEKTIMETLHGQEMIDIMQQAYDRYMAK